MSGPNPSTLAARALVDALIGHGVRHVVISPGSRSAPLAYALAHAEEAGRVEVHVRIDERVAAFTALGLARFGPAAVVTTSGTAAANLHPALLEAHHAHLGLIAITADRPHEMRGVGANQTTEQLHMFGPHLHSVEIPAGAQPRAIANQVSRIAARATGAFRVPAPVHLNIAFRDPLVPTGEDAPGAAAQAPTGPRVAPVPREVREVEIDTTLPSVVVAGDGAGVRAAEFAANAGLPLLAEPSSGARGGPSAIGPYQEILPRLAGHIGQVVVFGRPTLSRPVSALLARAPHVAVVAEDPHWVDVTGNADLIAPAVRARPADPAWLRRWREEERAARERLQPGLPGAVLARALAAGQGQVMIGSSMAIRYADIHAAAGKEFTTAPVYAARGLAGIDGTIATAGGIALGSSPTRVILGDLTFAHDVGALAIGPLERTPQLQIVVLNDGGGGIFARLEHGQERYASTFARFFATPTPVPLEALARAYGYDYHAITRAEEIDPVLGAPMVGCSIVEVRLPAVSENSQELFRNDPA